MSREFPHLFSPLRIGPVTVPNRILLPAHGTMFADDNVPGERLAAYLAERARGGVGVIVTEITAVHPTSRPLDNLILGYDPKVIPGFRRVAERIHEHGAKVFGQVWHCGRQSDGFFSGLPLWAPSAIPCPVSREMPHAMTRDEIAEVVAGYLTVARHMKAAGYDGIELHGGHGYLIQQFLSPWSNRREDEYGGSLDNRLRFALEVVSAVRREVGPGLAVGMRISGDELTPGGLTLRDMQEIVRRLEATGALDYFSVSVGNYTVHDVMIGDMTVPPGALVPLAAGIKEAVRLPVATVMRIKDPVQAEQILADGHADLVAMCRALIADPELPLKAREGRLEEIRICTSCNQECRTHFRGRGISCIQNPVVGRERELGAGTLRRAERPRSVLVVGGGPAGMECARIAVLRGHRVVLCERRVALGGQVRIATRVPTRTELGEVIRFLETQVRKLGVEVRLETEVTPALVEREAPDVVVLATGSEPRPAPAPANGAPLQLTVWEALEDPERAGRRVVLTDEGVGFWQCWGTAEFLAERGRQVTVVTPLLAAGPEIPAESAPNLFRRLRARGARWITSHTIREVRERQVVAAHVLSGRPTVLEDVDTLIRVPHQEACVGLANALSAAGVRVHTIGDCVAPRRITEAIREGHVLGRAL
ncbi:MAG: FAD-dependent oxidoreductase [Candidatus Rokubacteria bacterium]|nr:FAD-dependent oxidoreductase [Candidatus Rokubacteria bacterium]